MSVTLSPPRPVEQPHEQERHWTTEEFYRAASAGVFDDPDRLEIIHGRIVEKMPTGPLHTTLSYDVAENLREAVRRRFLVREERAIHFAFDGELIPDIALVSGRSFEYVKQHPTPKDVVLLVEVADTSVEYDLGDKALLYAQAGIADYWVVLAREAVIVRHRQPTPNGYADVVRLSGKDTLSPLAAPDAVWTIDALLGRAEED